LNHLGSTVRRALLLLVGLSAAVAACSDPGSSPTAPGEEPAEGLPPLLSEIDASGSVLFRPAFELWSNGLEKERRILLPPGSRVDISDREAWGFPDGTLVLKRFAMRGPDGSLRNVETRVFRLQDGEWLMGSYIWNEAQSDAELVEDGRPVAVTVTNEEGRTFDHTVPGRTGCQACHASSPGFLLGFREVQLNRGSQLAELEGRGFFSDPLPAEPARVEADDPETLWVKGYVEANCVSCHNGVAEFDLSHDVFLEATVGVRAMPGPVRIVPGDPGRSHLFRLFESRQMPPVGVQLRHDEAVERMRAWIAGLE
jgi:hypothetical protein